MNKGLAAEVNYSKKFHSQGYPLLVDPSFLKELDCGQIDLARVLQHKIEVIELKSTAFPHRNQYMRIKRSCKLLADLLERPTFLEVKLSENNSGQEETGFLP